MSRPVAQEHPVGHNIRAMAELERKALGDRTHLDRLTDTVARVAGSTPFIVLHAIWFTAWVVFNSTRLAFDRYPFNLLNLVVALEAVFLTSIVLMTQNHMLNGLCRQAGVHVAIRDERVQQLLTETDILKIAVALEQGFDLPVKT